MSRMIVPMALRLPLCPKCGDTKNSRLKETQMLGVNRQFECTTCKIVWHSGSTTNPSGTIVDGDTTYHIRPLEMAVN